MANQIQLNGNFRRDEGLASGTLKPGMLVSQTSAAAKTFIAHATEGGFAERAFVVEDALQGKVVTDSYSTGALTQVNFVEPGAEIEAIIESGENISIGDQLISSGTGTLISATGDAASGTDVKQVIAIAQEAIDLSDSDDVDTLAKVRVV